MHGTLVVGEKLIALKTDVLSAEQLLYISGNSFSCNASVAARHGHVLGWPVVSLSCCVAHSFQGLLAKTPDKGASLLDAQLRPTDTDVTGLLLFFYRARLKSIRRLVQILIQLHCWLQALQQDFSLCSQLSAAALYFMGSSWGTMKQIQSWFLFSFFVCLEAIPHIPHSWWLLYFPESHSECCTYKPDTCHL